MASKATKTTLLVLVSGLGGIALFIVVVAGILQFSGPKGAPENKITFHDKAHGHQFITALEESGVPFRKDTDGSIWYSVENQVQVQEVRRALESSHRAKFSVYEEKLLSEFLAALDTKGIKYSVHTLEKGSAVLVSGENQAEAREAFSQAMSAR